MRLTDADGLYTEIYNLRYTRESPSVVLTEVGEEIFNSAVEAACCLVAQSKTIDAVPVVRCKDCLKRKTNACPMYFEEFEAIDSYDGYWFGHDQTKDDGFCQCGEKRR